MPSLGLGLGNHKIRPVFRGLLDQFGGAAAAYSLRNLTSGWSGSDVILARRSSDNAELGFTSQEVTNGTLTTWAGAGDAFVKTWYDQSGNARDATQATAGSQPKIVSSGSLITNANGDTAIQGDGSDDYLRNITSDWNTITAGTPSIFSIFEKNGESNKIAYAIGSTTADDMDLLAGADAIPGDYAIRDDVNRFDITAGTSGVSVFTQILGTGGWIDNNAASATGLPISGATSDRLVILARRAGNIPTSMKHSELIVYPDDQSANRTAIQTAIANHYGITLA